MTYLTRLLVWMGTWGLTVLAALITLAAILVLSGRV